MQALPFHLDLASTENQSATQFVHLLIMAVEDMQVKKAYLEGRHLLLICNLASTEDQSAARSVDL